VADGPGATLKAAVATRRLRFVCDEPDRADFSDLEGITEVEIRGSCVSIDSLDADGTIRDLVGRRVPFRDLEVTGAGLEQAFVTLTECRAYEQALPTIAAQTQSAFTLGRGES
jgi:ABC-2 type transport system ATP-binding protein